MNKTLGIILLALMLFLSPLAVAEPNSESYVIVIGQINPEHVSNATSCPTTGNVCQLKLEVVLPNDQKKQITAEITFFAGEAHLTFNSDEGDLYWGSGSYISIPLGYKASGKRKVYLRGPFPKTTSNLSNSLVLKAPTDPPFAELQVEVLPSQQTN